MPKIIPAIKSKINTIIERVDKLKKYTSITYEEYIRSSELKDIIERNLQVAIEAAIDIGKIIISEECYREPSDNKGVFVVLAENGIIDAKLLKKLMPMAGTRNILVHGYDKVDDTVIFGILKKHLKDFDRFILAIEKNYIKKKV